MPTLRLLVLGGTLLRTAFTAGAVELVVAIGELRAQLPQLEFERELDVAVRRTGELDRELSDTSQ